jgi:multisubunit Na+/H+ antiporter MnhE subunit
VGVRVGAGVFVLVAVGLLEGVFVGVLVGETVEQAARNKTVPVTRRRVIMLLSVCLKEMDSANVVGAYCTTRLKNHGQREKAFVKKPWGIISS